MKKTLNFFKRNLKEILRDPIIYVFCLGFPVVMFVLFFVINSFTDGNTSMFEMRALLPAIIVFSQSFVMLTLSIVVSKDRQTFFLKRLYSSPMKAHDFILGYFFVGLFIGILQAVICVLTGFIIALFTHSSYVSFLNILLLIVSQIPMLVINIFLGILFGTVFNDKTAPGICSIFISLAGIFGGCWIPLETMGKFETFCRFMPFYPSVFIGRIITNATNSFGSAYAFNDVAIFGVVLIAICMLFCVFFAVFAFKKNMTSDK